jgi:hypothetical protein
MNQAESTGTDDAAAYRYGVVFLLTFAVVAFIILAPDGALSRAVDFALIAGALLVVIGTSRERGEVRRRRMLGAGVITLVLTIGIAIDAIPRSATFLLAGLLALAIPVSLGRGLLRLVRARGVTTQAVAGALAIYLLVGLTFAFAVGFVAAVGSGDYFAQGTNGDPSTNVYYSFTVLTTTGFGDFTAAHHVGRAIAVTEMLVGQLYLVTVIGILIGRRVGAAE